jgi:hypothetical protein
MLRTVSLARQWERIQTGLPEGWGDARLSLRIADERKLTRATGLLGPLQPTRSGRELRFYASRQGAGPAPAAVARALARLDEDLVGGELTLAGTGESTAAEAEPTEESLVAAWDAAVETLPEDWSDLYAQIELTSSDHLEPAALALAPLNPGRYDASPSFRFRCARLFGYGVSPQMARRCLQRLDERGIPGKVGVLRVLSDTRPVATQGPVWYVGGKAV